MSSEQITMPDLNKFKFEQGPIRPPSEAYSLLIRVTRNCPWNRCLFCSVYKQTEFELRTAEEVSHDILKARAISEEIKALSFKLHQAENIREIAAAVYNQPQYDWSVRNVAMWMWAGGSSVFMQDANSLIMRTPDLIQVLNILTESFPQISRITSYARSNTAARKTMRELCDIKEAGLSRVHIGLESGSDKVLAFVDKGVTAAQHIEGGVKIKQAGMELSEYIIPGLGGREMSEEHAIESASVLNQIDPDFVRLRSIVVGPAHPLWIRVKNREYECQTDDEIVIEIRKLIERLAVSSYIASDHMMNLLPEIEGKFPDAKADCLRVIDRYLSLSEHERNLFKIGRRTGLYDKLDDITDSSNRNEVEAILASLENNNKNVDDVISDLKTGMAV